VPRVALTRKRVLEAGIRLADAGGIESITMRKLGRELGVEAMSLYNHVANKDDLLDGIVDIVLDEFELPDAESDWEAAVRRTASSAHEALVRHPWACSLVMSRTRPGRMRYIDALLRRLREAGFSPDETFNAYHALDSHILGYTMWELGHSFDPAEVDELVKTFMAQVAVEYPDLHAHAEQHFDESRPRGKTGFEFGLDLILDGLKRMRG
jgi:AcrR family transcriptional regulator